MTLEEKWWAQIAREIQNDLDFLEAVARTQGDYLVLDIVKDILTRWELPVKSLAGRVKDWLERYNILSWDGSIIGYVPTGVRERHRWIHATGLDIRPNP